MKTAFFGEILLRLTPAVAHRRLVDTAELGMGFAGAESNVAVSLAFLGNKASYITKLPDNALGDAAIASLQKYGIETQKIHRGGPRIGTYFIELGNSIRPSRVVYDRAYSSLSQVSRGEFDWNNLLEGFNWLHMSGITPALSEQCALDTIEAAKAARALGCKVSFDLNFRRSLWQDATLARKYFEAVIENTDLLFGNTGVLDDVFDWRFEGSNTIDQTAKASDKLNEVFGINSALTCRKHASASSNQLSGILNTQGQTVCSQEIIVDVIDRFGTGDAFAAATLHGLQHQFTPQETIDFANAAFCLSHTMPGDLHLSSVTEIQSIAQGNLSGHVIR